MADYAKLGIDQVMVMPQDGAPAAWIDAMAPMVTQLVELG
jgi:hypothetical protein